jgi:hypothetical protein
MLRIQVRDDRELQEFRETLSKVHMDQAARAKAVAEPLATWIRHSGHVDKTKAMIKGWFEKLSGPIKLQEVQSVHAIAIRHNVATDRLMDAGKPLPAKFPGFLESLGSDDNAMRFYVDVLRFKMLDEAEQLVTSQ